MLRKSLNHPADYGLTPAFREENDTAEYLSEMANYPGSMSVLCEALEKESVRFDEARFGDGQITHHNQYVTISRGDASDFLHRAIQGIEHRKARQKMRQRYLSVCGCLCLARPLYSCAIYGVHLFCNALKIAHRRSCPQLSERRLGWGVRRPIHAGRG